MIERMNVSLTKVTRTIDTQDDGRRWNGSVTDPAPWAPTPGEVQHMCTVAAQEWKLVFG